MIITATEKLHHQDSLNKQKNKITERKKEIIISLLNVRRFRSFCLHKLLELAEGLLNDAVCPQEHRFIYEGVQIKEHDAGKH